MENCLGLVEVETLKSRLDLPKILYERSSTVRSLMFPHEGENIDVQWRTSILPIIRNCLSLAIGLRLKGKGALLAH